MEPLSGAATMRPSQALQLTGRHVLLLVTACLLPGASAEGCHDSALNVTRAHGEQWLLPDCGGVAHCRHGSTYLYSCPPPNNCRWAADGDASAAFPRCCPRYACSDCYSEQLDREFGPGSHWTERPCVRRSCRLDYRGAPVLETDGCEELGPPPSLDCEVVLQDMSRGEFPLCCAHYRCPGLCRSGDRWVPVAGPRGDACREPADPTRSDSDWWGVW